MTVALVPYACGLGSAVTGCERGPEFALAGGLKERLARDHISAIWLEGLEPWTNSFIPPLGSAPRATILQEHLIDAMENVANAAQRRLLPVCIGGDQTAAIAGIAGLAEGRQAHGKIGLLWMDAHLDASLSPEATPHTQVLAALLGQAPTGLEGMVEGPPLLDPRHLCIFGASSYTPAEQALVERSGARVITLEEIRQQGMTRALTLALDTITQETNTLYLSLDLDVLSPEDAPAVSLPETGGLTRDELLKALDYLTQRIEFHGLDISEYNPQFDRDNRTLALIGDALIPMTRQHAGLHVV